MATSKEELREFLTNNVLFDNFSEYQIDQILPLMDEMEVPEGGYVMHENDISNDIYLIKAGEVIVEKTDTESQTQLQLAVLGANAVVGELAILDNAPRSASVRALKPTTVYVLSISKLRMLSDDQITHNKIFASLAELADEAKALVAETSLFPKLMTNLAKGIGKRLRSTNDAVVDSLRRELRHTKARVVMGKLIITVIVILSVYIMVLKLLEELHYKFFSSTLVSAPLIAIFGVIVYWEIAKTGYPLRFYGLTLRNWRPAVKESLLVTILMLALMVLFKWILIHTTTEYANHPLFELKMLHPNPGITESLALFGLLIYLIFVPLQELIVRGALQSSFQELLISPHKTLMSILLSNLLFSVTHFHISIVVGLSVFLPGLFWGWLYSRHRTLVGVSISHQIFGIWALSIIGL